MATLIKGGGVLHSKLLVADRKHFYLGSANLSDRGLTKTKEMGIFVSNCPELAEDAAKLFDVYWNLGGRSTVPKRWEANYQTLINLDNPMTVRNSGDGQLLNIYFGSSPTPFCPPGTRIFSRKRSSTGSNDCYVVLVVLVVLF
jgi:phospholipase D3/4